MLGASGCPFVACPSFILEPVASSRLVLGRDDGRSFGGSWQSAKATTRGDISRGSLTMNERWWWKCRCLRWNYISGGDKEVHKIDDK